MSGIFYHALIFCQQQRPTFTVHVKHGTTRKYSSRLVEAVAKDLSVTPEEFQEWYISGIILR